MPEADFNIARNDLASIIPDTLLDANSQPVDIQGATVKFHMRPLSSSIVKIARQATNAQVGDGADGTRGKVFYSWILGDTDTAGIFIGEFEVTYSGGQPQTYPNTRKILIAISEDIA